MERIGRVKHRDLMLPHVLDRIPHGRNGLDFVLLPLRLEQVFRLNAHIDEAGVLECLILPSLGDESGKKGRLPRSRTCRHGRREGIGSTIGQKQLADKVGVIAHASDSFMAS